MLWNTPSSPSLNKANVKHSATKVVLSCIITIGFLENGKKTVTGYFLSGLLTNMRSVLVRERNEKLRHGVLQLHDNTFVQHEI